MTNPSAISDPPRDPYHALLESARRQRQLFSVHWELTYRCNERCSHCYLDVLRPGDKVPGELSTDECLGIVDQLDATGVLNLAFSGGEVLTRPDFFTIAEYAHAKRFVLRIFTNGLNVTPVVADRLAALHPYAVEISLYGIDSITHEAITRVPGSFTRTTEAFRLLHARGVRTMMKTPLMHDNINQFQQLRELAEQLGAILRTDQIITSKLNGDPAPLRHRMTEEEQLAFMRATLDPKQWPHTVEQDEATCLIGQSSLLIDPSGDVFPCAEVRLRAGNLRQQPLDEIWSASPIWQKVLGLVRSTLPVCHTCALAGWCVRCHGGALNETGDLRGPSPAHCRAAHLRRQALIEELDEGDTIERHATTDTRSPWLAQQESKRAR